MAADGGGAVDGEEGDEEREERGGDHCEGKVSAKSAEGVMREQRVISWLFDK